MKSAWERVTELARHGALAVTGVELLLLGRSRKALDIAKLSEELKVQRRLQRKYGAALDAPLPEPSDAVNKTVWLCWLQGMENAPALVKRCYASVQEHFRDWRIVVLTSENLSQYARLPDPILEKWRRGCFGAAHLTDLVRTDLLTRLGGLWLDATVLCTGGLSAAILESDLFLFQILSPNAVGRSLRASSWLIWAKPGNPILAETRALLWRYWAREERLFDYFLWHHFLSMAMARHPAAAKRVPPAGTTAPHLLQYRLFEPYSEGVWALIRRQTDFHKLTYKLDEGMLQRPGTFYDVLIAAPSPEINADNAKT